MVLRMLIDYRKRWCSFHQIRRMTSHKRVQDRSKSKRVQALEIATEKHKTISRIMFLFDFLRIEPERITPVRSLSTYRAQINLPKPYKIRHLLMKSPKLFELYKDANGVLWCGLTNSAEQLLHEEDQLLQQHSAKAAEHVSRFLMMSVDKRLPLDKIAHFRRDFGLPLNFRSKWVNQYPDNFKVVKIGEDGDDYLELVNWNPDWAVTELEKKTTMGIPPSNKIPGLLSLPFPLKFPSDCKAVFRYSRKIEDFQKLPYLSPYADSRGKLPGSKEFDKRAVAVMHELLSFTIDKRLVTDHLTHFRQELVMPQKLMRLLLKHFGIFYVSERGRRFSVFLTEAYEGRDLIEKCPLALWREKVLGLAGYSRSKTNIKTFMDVSSDEEDTMIAVGSDNEEKMSEIRVDDDDDMDVGGIHGTDNDIESLEVEQ